MCLGALLTSLVLWLLDVARRRTFPIAPVGSVVSTRRRRVRPARVLGKPRFIRRSGPREGTRRALEGTLVASQTRIASQGMGVRKELQHASLAFLVATMVARHPALRRAKTGAQGV